MSLQKLTEQTLIFSLNISEFTKFLQVLLTNNRNLLAMFIKPEVMQTYELSEIDPLNVNLHKKWKTLMLAVDVKIY